MRILSLLFLVLLFSIRAYGTCDDFLEGPQASSLSEIIDQWEEQKLNFSRRQVKVWSEALEHLVEDLKEIGSKSSAKDQLIKTEFEKATLKLSEIHESYRSLQEKDKKAGYFKEAFSLVWAALSVHSHELVEAKSKDKDYSRYFKVLKTISEFDSARPEFSFYKIRRAVEGRFSLKEFVNCHL